ncbi:MAG: heavy metal-binding domain-containing protein [Actinobacteria bacterium]|nr:heavy metal-binding domain-containing protein [Actinomycetota bacterium]MCB8997215.1 heavy metal-binding domain-containing protein [Actinomycetota bacterium]MCB9414645.1 heavy metal-binding domain-containing protein [Actinomycetota bacterium]MCB9423528.1 heavy metal-binding domain-containing protein [Actinomycetota bacterium]HRY10093.1 heavy metal-binding domain-containing protein [Candidatus Nanopelagicales bacterium]
MSTNADQPIQEAIPCTTAFEIPGYTITKHLGLTWGVLVRSVGFAKGFTGSFRSLKAGEVPQYTDVVDQARRDALERLIAHAQSLGANAIIGVRFDSSDVGGGDQGLTEILAYGSAVVVQPT